MRSRLIVAMTAVLLCLVQPCLADVVITIVIQGDAIDDLGVAPGKQTNTTWLGETKFREDSGARTTIVDTEAKKLFIIDHNKKSYFALDLPVDLLGKLPPGMRAEVEQMLNNVVMDVKVTPTDESKEINGYMTKKYLIEVGGANVLKMTREQWMAEDIGFDIDSFKSMMQLLLTAQPMGSEWLQQILDIKGFPVLAESSVEVMGKQVKTREELVSIETKSPAADTYAPPADYTEEVFDFFKMIQQQAAGG